MSKTAFSIYAKTGGAGQLCSNGAADQRHCFPYMDGTVTLVIKS